jgi:hypothetical protein
MQTTSSKNKNSLVEERGEALLGRVSADVVAPNLVIMHGICNNAWNISLGLFPTTRSIIQHIMIQQHHHKKDLPETA